MRSILCAMALDTLKRGRWQLPLGFLGGNFFTVILFATLRGPGISVVRDDRTFVLWQLIATNANLLCFGSAVVVALGRIDRFFTLPISNRSLVTNQLIIGMILMTGESLFSTLFVNSLYGLDWPFWGPALFGAVTFALVYAAMWMGDRSLWLVVELAVVASLTTLWYRNRHGGLDNQSLHHWDELTIIELLTLASAALVAYFFAVLGVGWRRRGEPPLSVGFIDWAKRWFDPPLEMGPPFRSGVDAQFWFERRQKAAIMPAIVICGLIAGFLFWLTFDRSPQNLLNGSIGVGYFLIGLGLVSGFVFGNSASGSPNPDMGSFQATRPVSSTCLANAVLKTAAQSILTGWLIWIAAVAVVYGTLVAFHVDLERVPFIRGGVFPVLFGCLVGSWIAAGLAMTCLLTGRTKAIVMFTFGGLTIAIGWLLAKSFLVPRDSQELLEYYSVATLGAVGMAITATSILMALRAGLISKFTALGSVVTWSLLGAAAIAFASQYDPGATGQPMSVAALLFYLGLASLAVAPISAAPLALAWNRVR